MKFTSIFLTVSAIVYSRLSHTARRSGIANLYLTGLFDTVQMMSISGHKDQRTFFDYIKLSSDEIADKIMEKLCRNERMKHILFRYLQSV